MNHFWRNKRIVITGASSGLGMAVTRALAPYGCQFALLSRRTEPMISLAKELGGGEDRFFIASCDVRDYVSVQSSIDTFAAKTGGLDVAWVNSGVAGETSWHQWDWERINTTIDVNIRGALHTIHASLHHMAPAGQGTIVGISSAASMRGLPGRTVYSMSKIALNWIMDSLAAEFPTIRFVTIMPGFIDTPINQDNPNRFWLMQPERAALLMIRAAARGKSAYIYPFRMKLLYHLIHSLPTPVYRRLGNRLADFSRPGR